MPNNRINAGWQLHFAPLPASYAERWAAKRNAIRRNKDYERSYRLAT